MKRILAAALFLAATFSARAQNVIQDNPNIQQNKTQPPFHRIIFQLTTDDTLAQKALMRQLGNILVLAPDTKLEVVCHGPGLNMLVAAKSIVRDKIRNLDEKGVVFVACEFSMSEKNITKDKMIPEAGFVKGGIIEIVTRQEEGWSYIKSGF